MSEEGKSERLIDENELDYEDEFDESLKHKDIKIEKDEEEKVCLFF